MQRRLWRVCTFAQAHLSLRPGTEISCAGSNNDLHTVYKNSECCGEAAPATMAHIGNHQCVVSMRQKCSHCFVIKFLNKTLASLPRKKIQSGNRFWILLHVNMITAALRHGYSPQFRQLHLKKAPVTAKLQNFFGFAVQTMNQITNCLAEP